MKFGKNLPRNQVPEWAGSYIDYKRLKKLIKTAAVTASQNGDQVDLAEFLFALDREVECVDQFYTRKLHENQRRLQAITERYGPEPRDAANIDEEELEDLIGALLEIRNQLRNLQWFGEINRRGFVKITKKLDKKVHTSDIQERYISTKVDVLPFATNVDRSQELQTVNTWLSVLNESKSTNDAKSDRSTRSYGRPTKLDVDTSVLNGLDQAVRQDNVGALESGLSDTKLAKQVQTDAFQNLLRSLLQRAISARSKKVIPVLLGKISDLADRDDINGRNCIHRLVTHIGRTKTVSSRTVEEVKPDAQLNAFPFPTGVQYAQNYITPATSPLATPRVSSLKETAGLLGKDDEAVQMLIYLLDNLKPEQRVALKAKDNFGRVPLHYAAQFGFVVVCQILMKYMQDWGMFNVENGIDAPEWQDKNGDAPLHLSVLGGHALTTKALLQGENWQGVSDQKAEMRRAISKSSAVLAIATKANFKHIVEMLVGAGVDINWQDKTGETALHIAARFGHDECAMVLLKGTADQKADIELTEKAFAWTPLHIAAVDGHLPVVKLLVEAGAEVDRPDSAGWTAREHAALRGHMPIAHFLAAQSKDAEDTASSTSDEDRSGAEPAAATDKSSFQERRSKGSSRSAEPVKSFGHRYLKNESLVLVSLGSMDMRKNLEAVKLDNIPLSKAHTTELDTTLSIVVSAQGAHGEPTMFDLPVHDNISTEPVVFTTVDASKVKLFFDIVPTYSGNSENKVGRGVALLSSVRPTIGTKRMNLQGDVCVPIMGANFEVIGSVNFNFLVITPFSHPSMEVTSEHTYWKKMASTMVIGHRGLGKNMTDSRSLQLGENTVSSFIAAANLGANYVEFDVQLTKDHVPVIYHDFLVSETGFDAPVHTLTLEQFLHINPDKSRAITDNGASGSSGFSFSAAPENKLLTKARRSNSPGPRQRSMSMDWPDHNKQHHLSKREMEERMKHTRDFKEKGFKANSRGNFIQAPFATLEDLFVKLPASVGFNIEMKYPMLHESEEHEMDTYAVELNSFCDTVLQKVYDMTANPHQKRNIIFSSFNPDICLCLSFKQPNIPILFLTDAGTCPVGDIRASSLQEAIRFASRWNLLGIVSNAEPFVNSGRLVRVVKGAGLVCVSYGRENNEPELVRRQVREGVDAVIVDSVLAIRKGLLTQDGGGEGKRKGVAEGKKEGIEGEVEEVRERVDRQVLNGDEESNGNGVGNGYSS
ncbi:Glycerophosphoryl diester phosphodiesterase family-domain-containing protein [Triangularia verruculosa]|uniref:Glycerophosphoryl diester phosphodiesterase family-domain-containing protein n=1 Tax=Triangularia verruculosa TaxID=2587418 RepID=A0AAN7ATG0_9PEZI|nr:Glycerophosphoryl diester phosphodiesterase family-domain-containing protein [Triangularia verruculosa]